MTSIWGRQEQRLQELINRLAEEHATVAFAPKNSPELREFRERLRHIVGAPQLSISASSTRSTGTVRRPGPISTTRG